MFEFSSILSGPGLALQQRSGGVAQIVEQMRLAPTYGSNGGPANSYATVATVYACVKLKADAVSRMLLMVSDREGNAIESGPLVSLAENPNRGQTGRKFWRDTSAFLDLFGQFHWLMTRDSLGRPVEVFTINPAQMTPVVDRNTGALRGWKYRAVGRFKGQEELLPVEDLYTFTDPDFECPDEQFKGLSPRAVAMRAIRQLYKADIANEASLDNGVEPGGVFSMPGTPTQEQIRDLREDIDERHRGASNRRRHLLLYGAITFQTLGANFTDMEFVELKKMSRVDVCAAFQVPPACVGFYDDSNYAHATAAEESFWIRTIIPRGELLAEEWTSAVLAPYAGDRSLAMSNARRGAVAPHMRRYVPYMRAAMMAGRRELPFFTWFDSSQVPAVQRSQLSLADQMGKWVQMGIPLNDAIATFGLLFAPVKWGDTWFKPIGLVDVRDDSLPGSDDPNFTEPPPATDGPAAGQEGPVQASAAAGRGTAGSAQPPAPPAQTVDKATEKEMTALWTQWRATWAGLEKATLGKVRRHFNELRAKVLKAFEQVADELAPPPAPAGTQDSGRRTQDFVIRNAGTIARILISIGTDAGNKLKVSVGPLLREAARLGGEQSMQEAAAAKGEKPADAKPFNMADPAVVAKLRQRESRISGIDATLKKRLAETLADGVDRGENTAQLAERIRSQFNFAAGRAATIARTEVGGAVEEARHEGRKQSGVPMKSWLWSRKQEGRARHGETEANTRAKPIPNDEEFVIAGSGVRCIHPRGSGVAAEDVNCACSTIARFPNDSLKSVLARYKAHGFLTYDGLRQLDAKRLTMTSKDAEPCQPGTDNT